MPINIGKSQILFSSRKGSFFVHFCVIFGISKSTARWVLANTGLSNSANYTSVYTSGPVSREYLINRLFFTYKNYPYFIFGRELKHLRFIRKKKFFASNQVKSIRMRSGLPIWGQRTHSNAQTSFRVSKFFTLVVVFNGKTTDLHLVITSSSLVDAILDFLESVFVIYKTFDFPCLFLPIGALTSKTYAFTARPWELEIKKSVDFFDFFAYPITVYSKGSEVFRITSFDMQFWISDSTRFFVVSMKQQKHDVTKFCVKLSFNKSVSKLSWFETALFINSKLFYDFTYFNFGQVLGKGFFNFVRPAKTLRALNLFSVDRFVDLKDLALLKHTSSFIRGNSFSVCPKSFFSVFRRFSVLKIKPIEIGCSNNWMLETNTFDVRYFFVFDSNLRYQAPVLNAKLKFFTSSYPDTKVYLFGKNTSYFSNYPVAYCGEFKDILKLFAGRFSSISTCFFSKNSVSIFGPEILKLFCKSLTWGVFNRVYENLSKVIFLQSDFTQNSKNIFGVFSIPQFFNPLFFSTFSKSLVNFNFFYFNSAYLFCLPRQAVDFFSFDFKNFIFPRIFKFQTITKTSTLVNASFEPFSWVYSIPTYNFGFTSNSYISLASKVCKVSKIVDSVPFNALPSNYSVLYYIFKTSMFSYVRYRSLYNTFLSYSNIAFYRVSKLVVRGVGIKAGFSNVSVFDFNNSSSISNFGNCVPICFMFPASIIDIFFSSAILLYYNNVFQFYNFTNEAISNLITSCFLSNFFKYFINIFKSQYYLNVFFLQNNLPSVSFSAYTFFFNFFCIPSFNKIYFNFPNLRMNSFLVTFFSLFYGTNFFEIFIEQAL